jgi:hypothetical protein
MFHQNFKKSDRSLLSYKNKIVDPDPHAPR